MAELQQSGDKQRFILAKELIGIQRKVLLFSLSASRGKYSPEELTVLEG